MQGIGHFQKACFLIQCINMHCNHHHRSMYIEVHICQVYPRSQVQYPLLLCVRVTCMNVLATCIATTIQVHVYIYIYSMSPIGTYMPRSQVQYQILGTVSIGMHVMMLEVPSQVNPQVLYKCIMISMVQYVQPIGRHLYIHKAYKYSLRYYVQVQPICISLQYSLSIGRDTYYALSTFT